VIVAARYVTSNAIHQMSKLPREEWDAYLAWLEEYEYDRLGLPRPDSVVFLDMPPQVAASLVLSRYGGDAAKKDIHERDARYLAACRPAALYAAEKWGWHVISCPAGDAPRPMEEITEEILQTVKGDISL
jgi:dTMP kinase